MEKEQERGASPMLFARVPPEVHEEAQVVANEDFDGNVSMLVRVAVKQFIERRRPHPIATDTDMKVA